MRRELTKGWRARLLRRKLMADESDGDFARNARKAKLHARSRRGSGCSRSNWLWHCGGRRPGMPHAALWGTEDSSEAARGEPRSSVAGSARTAMPVDRGICTERDRSREHFFRAERSNGAEACGSTRCSPSGRSATWPGRAQLRAPSSESVHRGPWTRGQTANTNHGARDSLDEHYAGAS